jgi:hypothetical protein
MKTLTIGFSKPINRFMPVASWLIRAYMGTKYSHIYIKFFSDKLSTSIIYESVGVGVRFIGSEMWQKYAKPVDEFVIVVPDDCYYKIMKYCVDNAGKPYDVMQNLGIVIANLFSLKSNPLSKGADKSNCSEEIARILIKLGYHIEKSPDLITPRDLYEILSENGVFNK